MLRYLDLSSPMSQTFLEGLLPFVQDDEDQKSIKSMLSNSEQMHSFISKGYSTRDVFRVFPSLSIDFASFATLLDFVTPRMYKKINVSH